MSGEMYDPAKIAHYFQLVVAVQNKQLSQVKQLLSIALADINFINLYDRNRTLLHDAVASGDPAIVTLLLSHEPDTEIADLNGRKPFELSSELNPADKKAVDAVFRKHFRTTKRGGRLKPEEVVQSGDLCFTKRPGTAAVGQYYETKLLTMVLFRALIDDRIVSFCLGNNLDEAGAFDDVVLRYSVRTGDPDRLVCLQAKHRDDKKRVEFKDLIDEKVTKGDLHMLKYFLSYLMIRLVCSTSRDAIFEGIFVTTQVELILFTTAGFNFTNNVKIYETQKENIWYTKEAGKTSQVECTDTMRQFFKTESSKWYRDMVTEVLARLLVTQKLDTTCLEDAIQKLGVTNLSKFNELDLLAILDDQMGRNVLEIKKRILPVLDKFPGLLLSQEQHETLVENFFSVLRLYTEQATEQELDEVIRNDLKGHYREDVFLKAHESVQSWWKRSGQVPFQTEECKFFERAAKEIELEKWSSNCVDRIKGFGVKFEDRTFKHTEWVEVLNEYLKQDVFCLNLFSRTPELSCLKLMQYLEKHEHFKDVAKHINLRDCKVNDLLSNLVLSKPNCLILTSETALTCEIVEEIVLYARKFVFISPLQCTGYWRSVPDDSEGLKDLDEESQKRVLLKEVCFQNIPTQLSAVLGDAPRSLVVASILESLLCGKTLNICQTCLPKNCIEIMSYYIERGFQDSRGYPLEFKPFNEIGDRVVVLAAEPGMGKSTTLTGMAFELKRHDPAAWVVRINLIEYSRLFNRWDQDRIVVDDALAYQFLVDHLRCASPDGPDGLFEQLLCEWYCKQRRIFLLLDGYDEVSPDYNDIVMPLLHCFSNKYCAKMWITTRSGDVQHDLSGRFNSLTHFLAPFSTADSEQFLWKFWKYKLQLSDANEHRCRLFRAKLFELFRNDYDIN
ncbi:uncharacterized protein LOC120417212 isoform X1 [Culex pipiens pallens]|uniref:uncharacterized protein LOC120417212 isoform X1 n=1 Tax=Culex pipiens pallens TaxID=42434 RepID=UPI0022AAF0F1|nr:uncharacterized protein LOC120417212 isoform X1 [Culex pipiens pallens]XP_052562096.1 uncharacterized protein LOC120417212 isoform X1 [Culex pipiens pallens]